MFSTILNSQEIIDFYKSPSMTKWNVTAETEWTKLKNEGERRRIEKNPFLWTLIPLSSTREYILLHFSMSILLTNIADSQIASNILGVPFFVLCSIK